MQAHFFSSGLSAGDGNFVTEKASNLVGGVSITSSLLQVQKSQDTPRWLLRSSLLEGNREEETGEQSNAHICSADSPSSYCILDTRFMPC